MNEMNVYTDEAYSLKDFQMHKENRMRSITDAIGHVVTAIPNCSGITVNYGQNTAASDFAARANELILELLQVSKEYYNPPIIAEPPQQTQFIAT